MSLQAPTRALSLLSLTALLCVTAAAQLQIQRPPQTSTTALPATAPTTPPLTPAPVQLPAATPTRRAEVTYAAGQLTVSASNSSLNQILREIGRITAMKITGGVNDERVFGTYGPDTPAKVLIALLDGTGSNLLIVQAPKGSTAAAPAELVLTPRHGGPTPPNPNAPGYNDAGDSEPENPAPRATDSPFRQPPSQPAMNAPGQMPPPNASNPASSTPPDPAATTPATTQEQSPNGVKTPQQIYEQLLRLRNQVQTPPQ